MSENEGATPSTAAPVIDAPAPDPATVVDVTPPAAPAEEVAKVPAAPSRPQVGQLGRYVAVDPITGAELGGHAVVVEVIEADEEAGVEAGVIVAPLPAFGVVLPDEAFTAGS